MNQKMIMNIKKKNNDKNFLNNSNGKNKLGVYQFILQKNNYKKYYLNKYYV